MTDKCENCLSKNVCRWYENGVGKNLCCADYFPCPEQKNKDLFIKLPCKVGQTVWYVCKHYNGSIEVMEGKISMLQQKADKSWKFRFSHNSSVWDFKTDAIGIKYFLTKEEAEAKLKELK